MLFMSHAFLCRDLERLTPLRWLKNVNFWGNPVCDLPEYKEKVPARPRVWFLCVCWQSGS